MDDRNGIGQIMKQDYDQIRILPSDMKRLRRDNPQRALLENVERAAGLAQVKIKADISSPPQDVGAFPAAEKCRLACHDIFPDFI